VGQELPKPQRGDHASLQAVGRKAKTGWKIIEGVDEQFARWAKDPDTTARFRVNVYWAEVFSESVGAAGPRLLTGMRKSPSVEAAMERILKIPLTAGFDIEMPAADTEKEHSAPETSSKEP
jgi:hypothetical protein